MLTDREALALQLENDMGTDQAYLTLMWRFMAAQLRAQGVWLTTFTHPDTDVSTVTLVRP